MSQKFYPITCQSCGIPMKIDTDFGTNVDGSKNEDFCAFCYKEGKYTNTDISMGQMNNGCVGMMVKFGILEKTLLVV